MKAPHRIRHAALLVLSLILLGWTSPAHAWPTPVYRQMAKDTLRLMPPSLSRVLKKNEEALLLGVGAPTSGSPQDVERRIETVVRMVHDHHTFREIAQELGQLLRICADLSDGASGPGDPRMAQVALEYGRFVEAHLKEIPAVYDRGVPSVLQGASVTACFETLNEKRSASAGRLAEAFIQGDRVLPAGAFDYRSVPFAEASLGYSRAVTVASQLWLLAWSRSNGDLKGTPFVRFETSSKSRTGKR